MNTKLIILLLTALCCVGLSSCSREYACYPPEYICNCLKGADSLHVAIVGYETKQVAFRQLEDSGYVCSVTKIAYAEYGEQTVDPNYKNVVKYYEDKDYACRYTNVNR